MSRPTAKLTTAGTKPSAGRVAKVGAGGRIQRDRRVAAGGDSRGDGRVTPDRRAQAEGTVAASSPRRPKLATVVREHLLADMRSGRWRPGDRLPTEIELMARFGVSRAPVREAMQSLHLLGIVDISPRRGAVVRALPIESIVDLAILSGSMDPDRPIAAVFEFRDAMESAIAELSAANASDEQIETLRGILAENVAAVARDDRADALRIDVAFHAAIAEGSGNVVFQTVARALSGLLVELRLRTSGVPGAAVASLGEHQEIFAALAHRDGPAARRATERHIRNTRARYESASGHNRSG